MNKKTVIIGGVAGGATTAARLRRRDESMEIIMFEKGNYISYANCGLPYFIGDVIKSRDALLLQTPKAMKDKFNIDVRISSEVTEIFPDEKKIMVKNLLTGEFYEESYDNLVISTGSTPIRPMIPGIESDTIFTLWTIPETDVIKTYIEEKKPKKAAIIGGGFIGMEMAENLHGLGIEVSIIEMQNQVMQTLDLDMAGLVHENIRMNKVNLILNDGVKSFATQDGKTKIVLSSGRIVEVDMVILSIGVTPNSLLAKNAGLKLNDREGIIVDEYLQTSKQGIYAVGDVIEVEDYVLKDRTMIPLAGPANKQARILADNIAGDKKPYKGTLGTAVAKMFDLSVASVGINEKSLKAMGKKKNQDYYTVLINQKSHAGYYPGATTLTAKMLFEKDGKIIGAQIIGQDGVDKRIDTIASTMRLNGTVFDLAELELAYAPPFSSAKDPVNMLGFAAENVIKGLVSFMEYDELDNLLNDKEAAGSYTVLDVTEEMERMVFNIPDSYHIPLGQLRKRLEELDRNKQIIIYCSIGVRSYNAARILMQNEFKNVMVLSGGTSFYKSMHDQDAELESELTTMEESNLEQEKLKLAETKISKEIKVLDCCGLQCPGPIMKVYEAICGMNDGEVLQVSATDMGFARDIESWCKRTGNTLLKTERKDKENIVLIQKGISSCELFQDESEGISKSESSTESKTEISIQSKAEKGAQIRAELPQGKTLIVFSGDLDKVLASFIIANGAAAMGRPVTMFFTFWGLNALRKPEKVSVKKSIIDGMFGFMMPRGAKRLKLSKMHMSGMGTAMMKKVMKDKNVNSLEELMKQGMASGIKLIACTMSMDIMGITKEELIDGVEFAGVATYLGDAEESNVNLFI